MNQKLSGISPFMLDMMLSAIGVRYEDKATVTAAIPVIDKMVQHVNENRELVQEANALLVKAQPLIATLLADWKLVSPAVTIVTNAVASKNMSFNDLLGHLANELGKANEG